MLGQEEKTQGNTSNAKAYTDKTIENIKTQATLKHEARPEHTQRHEESTNLIGF